MFIRKDGRTLDYNFLLWRFDTARLDSDKCVKLETMSANTILDLEDSDEEKKTKK